MYLVRREIMDRVVADIKFIKASGGYNNTILDDNIVKGIKSSSTIKSFPCVQVQMGAEKMDSMNESGDTIHRITEVLVAISLNTSDISVVETYIEDMKALFSAGVQDTLLTTLLFTVKYVDGYVLKEVIPYVENTKNYSTVYVVLEISYTDVVDASTINRILTEDGDFLITQS